MTVTFSEIYRTEEFRGFKSALIYLFSFLNFKREDKERPVSERLLLGF